MFVVGITGGIGSGKSIVCRIFHELGIPVYNADQAGKRLLREDEGVRRDVTEAFGTEIFKDGELDRKALAKIVFKDKKQLDTLNDIIHPAVRKDFFQWKRTRVSPYVLKEAAIMIESGAHKQVDHIILVSAPKNLRIQRVMERDNVSRGEVKARMENQWTDAQKRPWVHTEIVNDGTELILPRVVAIHEHILELCGQHSSNG